MKMVDRLSNLIGIFNTPGRDLSGNRAKGDDLLGDAYEFLMRHFTTESGKPPRQFMRRLITTTAADSGNQLSA
ncbi:hypothetical protein [Sphaerotilus uruguayifluvii]|uniref:Type I restriction-modification system DNA methylase subunit n=1 Tax=Sphaerotilus uruguayifluvii TaxID=2735897 RepID=A0ABX2G5D6_9BURK|nr:hypothetical protein [Leptothrix sp. C29]NRT56452.1 type I restriction-modification system DNA methylase subunit [Leptothrix sp. C29]